MNAIRELIQIGESETTEFKQAWTHDCLKTLAAFANTRGGTLLIGVNDAGQVLGWNGTDADQQAIATRIGNKLPIQPSLAVAEEEGQRILVLRADVAHGIAVPYESRYYRRVGCTTQEVPAAQLGQFLLERTGQSWDSLPSGASLDEIGEQAVRGFCRRAKARLPNLRDEEPVAAVLQKLGLLNEDKPTNAAVLLFGTDPQRRFISANVHMGRFKDGTTILDDKMFGGTLFEQLDAVMRQFRQYLQVRYDIDAGVDAAPGQPVVHRREVWDYPLNALLEAVVNALVHRTYLGTTESITIRVYDDRVVIRNPGGLPGGITVEQLKEDPHPTIPRNPLLANVFYYAELVEKWGSGTTRILELCRQQAVPEPEYMASSTAFEVLFSQAVREERSEGEFLKEGQLRALKFLGERGRITNAQYQELAGVQKRQSTNDLRDLLRRGIIERAGTTGRGTYYVLKEASKGH
jgi:ATP-dependent DNA helicase RecG